MKVNPRRIPKTQHDVDKAYERGMEAGSKGALTIMLYVMQDKFGADEEKLKEFADAFNYMLDSIAKGYVKESDFESVLKVEYGTIVKVEV